MSTTTYWKGDKVEYTGKVEQLYGGTFYEIRLLEGHMVGQTKLTPKPPAAAELGHEEVLATGYELSDFNGGWRYGLTAPGDLHPWEFATHEEAERHAQEALGLPRKPLSLPNTDTYRVVRVQVHTPVVGQTFKAISWVWRVETSPLGPFLADDDGKPLDFASREEAQEAASGPRGWGVAEPGPEQLRARCFTPRSRQAEQRRSRKIASAGAMQHDPSS